MSKLQDARLEVTELTKRFGLRLGEISLAGPRRMSL